jgi:uncharacterized protein YidB (DUF937 family)
LPGLSKHLRAKGWVMSSWISIEKNKPISSVQINRVLGSDTFQQPIRFGQRLCE